MMNRIGYGLNEKKQMVVIDSLQDDIQWKESLSVRILLIID